MSVRRIHVALTMCLSLAGACSDSVFALNRSASLVAQDNAAQFRTDAATYAFTTTSVGTEGRIRATLTNRTGRTMYFVNCNGGTSLTLQRLEGAEWKPFWSPIRTLCLSAPITVGDGGTHTFDVRVFGGKAGSNTYPQFDRPFTTGQYRVIWNDAYFSYQDRLPWGELVPEAQRVSNSFVIIAP